MPTKDLATTYTHTHTHTHTQKTKHKHKHKQKQEQGYKSNNKYQLIGKWQQNLQFLSQQFLFSADVTTVPLNALDNL